MFLIIQSLQAIQLASTAASTGGVRVLKARWLMFDPHREEHTDPSPGNRNEPAMCTAPLNEQDMATEAALVLATGGAVPLVYMWVFTHSVLFFTSRGCGTRDPVFTTF